MKHPSKSRSTTTSNEPAWSEDQKQCIETLAEFAGGHHHLPRVEAWGNGVAISWPGDLSTFDGDKLTWLVLLAHARAVRFQISPSGQRHVKICAWKRRHGDSRELRFHERHPDLADLGMRITALSADIARRAAGAPCDEYTIEPVEG